VIKEQQDDRQVGCRNQVQILCVVGQCWRKRSGHWRQPKTLPSHTFPISVILTSHQSLSRLSVSSPSLAPGVDLKLVLAVWTSLQQPNCACCWPSKDLEAGAIEKHKSESGIKVGRCQHKRGHGLVRHHCKNKKISLWRSQKGKQAICATNR